MEIVRGVVADGPMEGRVIASLNVDHGFGYDDGSGKIVRYGWRPAAVGASLVGVDDDGHEVPCEGTWHVV